MSGYDDGRFGSEFIAEPRLLCLGLVELAHVARDGLEDTAALGNCEKSDDRDLE